MGLLIVILALCWAVGEGTSNATSSVRDNYRKGRDQRQKNAAKRRKQAAKGKGPAPRSAGVGAKTASGAVTIALSGFLISRGFVDGVRAGWPKGKERARKWADTRKHAKGKGDDTPPPSGGTPAASAPAPDDSGGADVHVLRRKPGPAHRPAPDAHTPAQKGAVPMVCPECGEPVINKPPTTWTPAWGDPPAWSHRDGEPLCPVVGDRGYEPAEPARAEPGEDSTTPNRTSTTGGSAPVSINTVTGGEVHSYDQLLAELNAIAVEAHAELEDAQADAERARQDAERIDTMTGSLTELEIDQETLGKISALTEAASARLEAANARAVAAETRASAAMDTARHVQQSHQALAEAYASAPEGGAKKEFYTNAS